MELPYYQDRLSLVQRHGWGRPLLVVGVLVIVGAYWWLTHGATQQRTQVEPYKQQWDSWASRTKPEELPVTLPDPRLDELLARQKAQEAENARLRASLEELQRRPLPIAREQQAAEKGEKPKPRYHRSMGYMAFTLPEQSTGEPPLYTLAPADTKISCLEETKANSDVENGATVKVNVNIYDTATRRHLLIPQGSTILQQYKSANLLYGNQRLPMYSTLLTLPNGKVIDMEDTHTMDQEGQAGLVTRVNNHFWRAVPAVLIQGVLRGSQQMVYQASPMASGVASSATQYGQKVVQPFIDMRPTIEVDPGEGCVVILQRALELPAYTETLAKGGQR